MRPVSPAMSAYIQNPGSFRAEFLILLDAIDRDTKVKNTIGFWTGDTNELFNVRGANFIFYGAGALIEPPEIVYESGLSVHAVDVKFSPLAEGFTTAVRLYDVRQQRVDMYRAFFNTASDALIETPHRIFKGRSDTLTITDAAEGSQSEATLTVVSSARALTRSLAAKHSDSTFKKRSGDRFLRYAETAGAVEVVWGNT